jgi:hypothetical protein
MGLRGKFYMKICGNSRGVPTWERGSSLNRGGGVVRIIIGIAHCALNDNIFCIYIILLRMYYITIIV